MKVHAIVAEFNPLHQGHHFLIKSVKQEKGLVLVFLSGSFTQRGEPVVIDKYSRAKDAIKAGADIVICHPVSSATSHGEEFSLGAMEFLLKMPAIDSIFCGGEDNNMGTLLKALEIHKNFDLHKDVFFKHLQKGESYTSSLKLTFQEVDPSLSSIFQPNMLLAFGYAKALDKHGQLSKLKIIPRISENDNANFLSASKIRNLDIFKDSELLSKTCFSSTPNIQYKDLMERMYQVFRPHFLFHKEDFSLFNGYENGLENRILSAMKRFKTYDEFSREVSSKRYSKVRVQRLLLQTYLGINKSIVEKAKKEINSFHVLAFNKKGQEYLKMAKKSNCKFFTNYKDSKKLTKEQVFYHNLEEKSTNFWSLLRKEKMGLDYSKHFKTPL